MRPLESCSLHLPLRSAVSISRPLIRRRFRTSRGRRPGTNCSSATCRGSATSGQTPRSTPLIARGTARATWARRASTASLTPTAAMTSAGASLRPAPGRPAPPAPAGRALTAQRTAQVPLPARGLRRKRRGGALARGAVGEASAHGRGEAAGAGGPRVAPRARRRRGAARAVDRASRSRACTRQQAAAGAGRDPGERLGPRRARAHRKLRRVR